jgi:GntR family transcriptional regulator, transcriptional repressor for pyruvate dehydrogenase complex
LTEQSTALVIPRPTNLVESMGKESVRLARDIANYISDQRIPQGTRLPTEQEMQQQFGVGRTTIREALRLLELRGVITMRSGRGGGPFVRLPRSTDLGEALQLVLQFKGATLTDIISARALIEPIAAAVAAENITKEALTKLQETNDSIRAEQANEINFSRQNATFHSVLGECLQLPVISVFLDSLSYVQDGLAYGVRYPPERIRSIARAHQKIIESIRARDRQGAEAAMRKHLDEAMRYWSSNYPQICAQPLRWLGD